MPNVAASFTINPRNTIETSFEIYAAGATWGGILGDINNQTDLKDALDSKADISTVEVLSETVTQNTTDITNISNTIDNYGNIVTHDADEFATAAQGTLANTALQPNDNISELVNNAGYITSDSVGNGKVTIQKNGTSIGDFTLNQSNNKTINITVPTSTSNLINDSDYITSSDLNGYATESWVENKGYITSIDSSDVTTALGYTPQAELTAGTNITIEGNTISASGTAGYVAGDNIQINGNTISATDTTYTAGANVIIQGNTISAVSTSYIAGDNITIENGTISATDTTYSAGSGITIENGTISAQATSYTAGNGITINGNTIATDTTIASKTDIGNATLTIYGNSTPLGTFSANATSATTVTVPIPTTATEVGALPSDTTIEDLTTESQQAALDSGATATKISAIASNTSAISDINSLIPNTATTANQLATEGFVNSSISTNTANFIGTFNSVAELEAYSGTLTNNDYAFVATTDSAGNTLYDRYKWNGSEWLFEYELNNSSFTSDQWAAINSGVTASSVSAIAANTSAISGKQDALTAGDNITIQNGTISATDTTYSAGANISIVGGTISATDTTYTQGNGITISGGTISTATTIASKTDIGNGQIIFTQGGVAKGTITVNQTSASTIDFDATASGGSLADLSDVSLTSIQSGQTIAYNGSVWVNTEPTTITFREWS